MSQDEARYGAKEAEISEKKEKIIEIKFGTLTPSIKEQLEKQNLRIVSQKEMEKIEKIRMAINMVRIWGIATEKEADNMFKRLLKRIEKAVE